MESVKLFYQGMKLSTINNMIGLRPFLSCGVQSGTAARLFQKEEHLLLGIYIQLALPDSLFRLRIGQMDSLGRKELFYELPDDDCGTLIPCSEHRIQVVLSLQFQFTQKSLPLQADFQAENFPAGVFLWAATIRGLSSDSCQTSDNSYLYYISLTVFYFSTNSNIFFLYISLYLKQFSFVHLVFLLCFLFKAREKFLHFSP